MFELSFGLLLLQAKEGRSRKIAYTSISINLEREERIPLLSFIYRLKLAYNVKIYENFL